MRHHSRSLMAHKLAACLTKVVRSTRASSGKSALSFDCGPRWRKRLPFVAQGLISSIRQKHVRIKSDCLHGISPQKLAILLRVVDSMSLFFARKTCTSGAASAGAGVELSPQLTAFFTSAPILASSAAVNSVRAKAVGHMAPSSRFALSLKPSVAYLVLNFCALWKKQTTLPSLAYAGIPYQSLGERDGALALMIAWSRSPMARSGSGISAIFASTALSPSALSARGPRRAAA